MKYDYICSSCVTSQIIEHSMKDVTLTVCPLCKELTLSRVISVVPFSFKGSGWASKDIRANSLK